MSLFDLDFLGFEKRAEKEQEGGEQQPQKPEGSSTNIKKDPSGGTRSKKQQGVMKLFAQLFMKFLNAKEPKRYKSPVTGKHILPSTYFSAEDKDGKPYANPGEYKKEMKALRKKYKLTIKGEDGKRKQNPNSPFYGWLATNKKEVEGAKAKKIVDGVLDGLKEQEAAEKDSQVEETKPKEQEAAEKTKPKAMSTSEAMKARKEKKEKKKKKQKGEKENSEKKQDISLKSAPKNLPNKGRGRTKKAAKFEDAYTAALSEVEAFAKKLLPKFVFSYSASEGLGKSGTFYTVRFSSPKHTWENNIAQNAPVSLLISASDNKAELLTVSYQVRDAKAKMRAFAYNSPEELKKKLQNYLLKSAPIFNKIVSDWESRNQKLASTSNLLAYAQHSPNPVKFLVKLASKLPKKEAQKALKQASKIASTARLLKTLKDEFSHANKVDPRDPAYVRVKELLRKLDDQTLEMIINEDIKFVSRLAMTILTMRKN